MVTTSALANSGDEKRDPFSSESIFTWPIKEARTCPIGPQNDPDGPYDEIGRVCELTISEEGVTHYNPEHCLIIYKDQGLFYVDLGSDPVAGPYSYRPYVGHDDALREIMIVGYNPGTVEVVSHNGLVGTYATDTLFETGKGRVIRSADQRHTAFIQVIDHVYELIIDNQHIPIPVVNTVSKFNFSSDGTNLLLSFRSGEMKHELVIPVE